MEIYFFTLVILFVFSILELKFTLTNIEHRVMLVFVYCLFVFQVGLRWQTGTDWDSYFYHFDEIKNISDVYLTITGFEIGYSFLILVFKFFCKDYAVFLLVHALFYHYLVFAAFKKYTPYIFVSLLVFYSTTLGVWGSNRQLIALAICFYALKYVVEKNTIKFFLLIFIAYFIHGTALLFIIYYFLNKDIKRSWIFVILGLSFVIGKTNIPFQAFSILGSHIGDMGTAKVEYYSSSEVLTAKTLSVFGLIKRLVFISLFLYNYKALTSKLPTYKLIFNGYFVGLVIYLLFSSSFLVLVNRGSLYFTTMEVLLLACQFYILNNKNDKIIFLVLLFIACIFLLFQSISGYPDLFIPYKGIFINNDFQRYRLD